MIQLGILDNYVSDMPQLGMVVFICLITLFHYLRQFSHSPVDLKLTDPHDLELLIHLPPNPGIISASTTPIKSDFHLIILAGILKCYPMYLKTFFGSSLEMLSYVFKHLFWFFIRARSLPTVGTVATLHTQLCGPNAETMSDLLTLFTPVFPLLASSIFWKCCCEQSKPFVLAAALSRGLSILECVRGAQLRPYVLIWTHLHSTLRFLSSALKSYDSNTWGILHRGLKSSQRFSLTPERTVGGEHCCSLGFPDP